MPSFAPEKGPGSRNWEARGTWGTLTREGGGGGDEDPPLWFAVMFTRALQDQRTLETRPSRHRTSFPVGLRARPWFDPEVKLGGTAPCLHGVWLRDGYFCWKRKLITEPSGNQQQLGWRGGAQAGTGWES